MTNSPRPATGSISSDGSASSGGLISGNGALAGMEAPPKPHVTARGVLIAALFWALYALLNAALVSTTEDEPFAHLLTGQLLSVGILALYSLPIWWLTVRRMDTWHWGWAVGAHLALGPLYAWGALESYFVVTDQILGLALRAELADRYVWILFSNATVYAIQFAIYHLVRARQRQRWRERQAIEGWARAREQELAALKAQINPHFLFNTLNSISSTLKRNPDRARDMIAHLSGMLRYALDASGRSLVPLREEIAFARRYLDLERHRFSDRLDVRYDIEADEADLDTPVPPMTLQPLVENALEHGIAPSEEGGIVTLQVRSDEGRLDVTVDDTGAGTDTENLAETNGSTGLRNTNARLVRTYGTDAALQTDSQIDDGFTVSFSVPKSGPAD